MEELSILRGEGLGKHLLAEERTDAVEGFEVHRAVGDDRREGSVDLLHVAGQVGGECLRRGADILHARLDEELIADVSVDELEDGLLKRNLSLQVGALEGSPGSLHVNAGTRATEGLELVHILGRSNDVAVASDAAGKITERGAAGVRTNSGNRGALGDAAVTDGIRSNRISGRVRAPVRIAGGLTVETPEGDVRIVQERRSSQRGVRNSHFLDDRTNDVRRVGEGATVNGVDEGGLAGQNASDLTNDTVHVLGREILDLGQRDTIGHRLFWLPQSYLNRLDATTPRRHGDRVRSRCESLVLVCRWGHAPANMRPVWQVL